MDYILMVLAGVDGLGPVRVNGGGNTCTNKIEHYNTIEETSTFLLFPAPLLFIYLCSGWTDMSSLTWEWSSTTLWASFLLLRSVSANLWQTARYTLHHKEYSRVLQLHLDLTIGHTRRVSICCDQDSFNTHWWYNVLIEDVVSGKVYAHEYLYCM